MGLVKPAYPSLQRSHPLIGGLVGAWPCFEGSGNRINEVVAIDSALPASFQASDVSWASSEVGWGVKSGFVSGSKTGTAKYNPSVDRACLAALVRLDGTLGAFEGIFINRGGANTPALLTSSATGSPLTGMWNGGEYSVDTGLNFTVGSVCLAAMSVDPTGSTIYLIDQPNGFRSYRIVQTNNPNSITGDWYIGYDPSNNAWQGIILDVKLWLGRALSRDEIAQLYFDSFSIYRSSSLVPWLITTPPVPANAPRTWFDTKLKELLWFEPTMIGQGWFDPLLIPDPSGTNFAKAINITSSESFNLNRQIGKRVTHSIAETVSLSKLTGKTVNLSSSSLVSIRKGVAHSLSLSSPEQIVLTKTGNKLILVLSPESMTVVRQVGKRVPFSQIQVLSLARVAGHLIMLSIPQVVSLRKAISKFINTIMSQSMSLTLLKAIGRPISFINSQVVSLTRQVGKAIAVTSGLNQAVALQRKTNKLVLMTLVEVVSLIAQRVSINFNQSVNVVQNSIVSVIAIKVTLKLVTVVQSQAVSLMRLIGKVVNVFNPQVVTSTAGKAYVRAINSVSAQVVTLMRLKGLGRPITFSQAQVITIRRAMGKTSTLTSPQVMAVLRNVGHRISHTQSMTVTAGRLYSRAVTFVLGQVVVVRRSVGKLASVVVSQLIILLRVVGKTTILTNPQTVTLTPARGIISRAIIFTQGQGITLIKGRLSLRGLSIVQGRVVTLRRMVGKLLLVNNTHTISLTRRTFTSISMVLNNAVTLIRQRSAGLNQTLTQSQSVAVDSHKGRVVLVDILVATAQAVTVSRAFVKTLVVTLAQSIQVIPRLPIPGLASITSFSRWIAAKLDIGAYTAKGAQAVTATATISDESVVADSGSEAIGTAEGIDR